MRARRTDANQPVIVAALRKAGAYVVLLHEVGQGVADLAALYRGVTYWLEVKSGRSAANRKGRTADDQREFRERARERGVHVWVVTSEDEALRAIGALREKPEGDGW